MNDGIGRELSHVELRTLDYLSRGYSNRRIASAMYVAEDTIKSRLRQIFDKLGAEDRAHAVRRGFETGLLAADDAADPVGLTGLDPQAMRAVARALMVSAHRVELRAGVAR